MLAISNQSDNGTELMQQLFNKIIRLNVLKAVVPVHRGRMSALNR